jgi:Protein of unknown function (DUF3383)
MDINDVLSVSVSRNTSAPAATSFSNVAFFGPNLNMAARLAQFSNASGVAAAVTGGTNSPEYKAALRFFAEEGHPSLLWVGYVGGNKVLTDNAGTFTAGSIAITVNGTVVTQAFSTDKNTTLTSLAAAIAALSSVNTATYSSGDHTITIVPESGVLLAVSVDTTLVTGTMTMAVSSVRTEDYDDALAAARLYDDNWYAFGVDTRTQNIVETVATWSTANSKLFGTSSDDANIVNVAPNSDTTSLAAVLKATTNGRTFVIYDPDADTTYEEMAVFAMSLQKHPGSYTLMYKTLASGTARTLTPTQSYNAGQKNCLVYEKVGGQSILHEGMVSSGEWFDVVVGIDWVVASCKTAVFAMQLNNDKISFDDDGTLAAKNVLSPVFQEGIDYKLFTKTKFDSTGRQIGGFYITTPDPDTISDLDKATRTFNGTKAVAFLAGAIHHMALEIEITY